MNAPSSMALRIHIHPCPSPHVSISRRSMWTPFSRQISQEHDGLTTTAIQYDSVARGIRAPAIRRCRQTFIKLTDHVESIAYG